MVTHAEAYDFWNDTSLKKIRVGFLARLPLRAVFAVSKAEMPRVSDDQNVKKRKLESTQAEADMPLYLSCGTGVTQEEVNFCHPYVTVSRWNEVITTLRSVPADLIDTWNHNFTAPPPYDSNILKNLAISDYHGCSLPTTLFPPSDMIGALSKLQPILAADAENRLSVRIGPKLWLRAMAMLKWISPELFGADIPADRQSMDVDEMLQPYISSVTPGLFISLFPFYLSFYAKHQPWSLPHPLVFMANVAMVDKIRVAELPFDPAKFNLVCPDLPAFERSIKNFNFTSMLKWIQKFDMESAEWQIDPYVLKCRPLETQEILRVTESINKILPKWLKSKDRDSEDFSKALDKAADLFAITSHVSAEESVDCLARITSGYKGSKGGLLTWYVKFADTSTNINGIIYQISKQYDNVSPVHRQFDALCEELKANGTTSKAGALFAYVRTKSLPKSLRISSGTISPFNWELFKFWVHQSYPEFDGDRMLERYQDRTGYWAQSLLQDALALEMSELGLPAPFH